MHVLSTNQVINSWENSNASCPKLHITAPLKWNSLTACFCVMGFGSFFFFGTSQAHGLDLKCPLPPPPHTHSGIEGMVPSWQCYWKVLETLGGRAQLIIRGVPLKGILGAWPLLLWIVLFICFGFLATICTASLAGLKATGPSKHGLKPLKPWARINLFFFKLIFIVILSQWHKADSQSWGCRIQWMKQDSY
jgi:hypothetical protein